MLNGLPFLNPPRRHVVQFRLFASYDFQVKFSIRYQDLQTVIKLALGAQKRQEIFDNITYTAKVAVWSVGPANGVVELYYFNNESFRGID